MAANDRRRQCGDTRDRRPSVLCKAQNEEIDLAWVKETWINKGASIESSPPFRLDARRGVPTTAVTAAMKVRDGSLACCPRHAASDFRSV
ncbi:hypothetical protein EVAR_41260_1 [Eumeta japonica]|uniref:Uncharacterized protein n=1 Tax=Eumeta variegata TaxID=151549 RepID=A0A4C1W3Q6_EUMVA|nr:hypothetical protein EVAR_41260_1 [Eumeta japonica]